MSRGRKVSRVKLIHPTPETAEKYLLDWNSGELYRSPEKFPLLDSQTFFGVKKVMQMEIGCGTGELICGLAADQPQKTFIGIDVSRKAIYFAVSLATKEKLENIRFIKADFKLLYPLVKPDSIEMVYLHFPDPFYGSKHVKHRIFDLNFLDSMHKALVQEGRISVVTDEEPFFMDMLSLAEEDDRYQIFHSDKFLKSFDPIIKSRFHRAWERIEKQIFHFILEKV